MTHSLLTGILSLVAIGNLALAPLSAEAQSTDQRGYYQGSVRVGASGATKQEAMERAAGVACEEVCKQSLPMSCTKVKSSKYDTAIGTGQWQVSNNGGRFSVIRDGEWRCYCVFDCPPIPAIELLVDEALLHLLEE